MKYILKVEKTMTYSEKFALFGLPNTDLEGYTSATQYAKKFKRCTVYSCDSVSYSSSTNLNKNNYNKVQYLEGKSLTGSE